jgi:hypothetical protein
MSKLGADPASGISSGDVLSWPADYSIFWVDGIHVQARLENDAQCLRLIDGVRESAQSWKELRPEWRGFLYFVYDDEIVIVDSRTYRIVAVIDA